MRKIILFKSLLALALVLLSGNAWAEIKTVTYTITSTNAVSTSGDAPAGSSAVYSSTYTQMYSLTSGNSMTLTLSNYEGCKIKGVGLSMKSNKSTGSGSLSLVAGTTILASISDSKFNSVSWYGNWSTTYVNVTPTMSNTTYTIQENEEVILTIAATANSLYCQSMSIMYEDSTAPVVSKPTFTPGGGNYEVAQSVAISCATEGASIHYTLDGSNPTSESAIYSEAITISTTTTLKAMAVKDDFFDSDIATAVYTIAETILPTSVIVTPATAELMIGESIMLTATVMPGDATNKNVTWESSDETIAIVSEEGVVTALAKGSVTITVKTVVGDKTATCSVSIVNPEYDVFTNALIGVSETDYVNWSGSGNYTRVEYKGQLSGGKNSIQLRATIPSGIVTTSFYGRVTKIVVEWNSNTQNGRKLDVYGKTTAYTDASDLYDNSKKGTILGSIVCGTNTELDIAADAVSDYIGLRSPNSAIYIDKIKIFWEQKTKKVTVSEYEWATASFSDRVIVPMENTVYTVSGVSDGVLDITPVPVGGVIGKNVGVLLYKESGGDLNFVVTDKSATVLGTGTKLVATGTITTSDYILGTYNGGFGFCHPSVELTCTSGKAFLPASAVTGSSAPFLRIGGSTHIANMEASTESMVYYDLTGRKVEQPERGIYIINGKKVIFK